MQGLSFPSILGMGMLYFSAEGFKNFYQAQSLWDEGMAERLSQFLKPSNG